MTNDQLAKIIDQLSDGYENVRNESAQSIIQLAEIGRIYYLSLLHELMEQQTTSENVSSPLI
jgi:hypothetical protein